MNPNPRTLFTLLFLAGLLLRAPGLLVNGIADVEEMIFHMGSRVLKLGLAHGLAESYGPFTYALLSIPTRVAFETVPFWWLPYKVLVLLIEGSLLGALFTVVQPARRMWIFILYWVNPFFILSGTWLGFFDSPHVVCAILAVSILVRLKESPVGWFLAGLALAAGALIKPQGLLFFPLPLFVYTALTYTFGQRRAPLTALACGFLAPFVLTTTYFVARGAPLFSLPLNYRTVAHSMPNLCNECFNLWRPVTRLLQWALGQEGPTYFLQLPRVPNQGVQTLTNLSVIACAVLYSWRMYVGTRGDPTHTLTKPQERIQSILKWAGCGLIALALLGALRTSDLTLHPDLLLGRYSPGYAVFLIAGFLAGGVIWAASSQWSRLVLNLHHSRLIQDLAASRARISPAVRYLSLFAFTALLIPQLGTRSHGNHSYAALVLFIPLLIHDRRYLPAWIGILTIQFYSYLASWQIGRNSLLPTRHYPYAQDLLQSISTSSSNPVWQHVSAGVERANQTVMRMIPFEPWVSILSGVQFLLVLVILHHLWGRKNDR